MIYLFRHGEIDSDKEKRFIGWTDLPLNANGIRQAAAWRERLSGRVFEAVYCSDLIRARRTADIIAGDRDSGIIEVPELREIHLGEFEALSMEEVRKRFPEKWRERGENIYSYRPGGGESFEDLSERVFPAFMNIAKKTRGNTLIVAHAGVNRMVLCRLLGMPPEYLFRLGQDYACLNRIDSRVMPFRVLGLNIAIDID